MPGHQCKRALCFADLLGTLSEGSYQVRLGTRAFSFSPVSPVAENRPSGQTAERTGAAHAQLRNATDRKSGLAAGAVTLRTFHTCWAG